MLMLRSRCWFRFLAAEDARDAADDAAHGEFALGVSEENFAGASATVIPTLEQGDVLHGFERGFCFRTDEGLKRLLDAGFHRLGFCVLRGLNVEYRRSGEGSIFDAEECN